MEFLYIFMVFPVCTVICIAVTHAFKLKGWVQALISGCVPGLITITLCPEIKNLILLISGAYTVGWLYSALKSSTKNEQKQNSSPQIKEVSYRAPVTTQQPTTHSVAPKQPVLNTPVTTTQYAETVTPKQSITNNIPTTSTQRAETVPYPNYLDYENCMYCHKPVTSATALFLSNGMKLHKDCYNRCVGNSGIVEKDVIGKAHAFWPGYPPDWDTRKAGVLREANYRCQICGRAVPLDVHHIKPITAGGTNEFSNLQAVCRDCHEGKHPGHDLSRDFDNTPQQIKDAVYTALSQKRELYIVYEDKNHNITERRVRPKRIIDRYGKKILIAYCYMRNEDNREFRLERMRNARITY